MNKWFPLGLVVSLACYFAAYDWWSEPWHHAPAHEIGKFTVISQPDDISCGPTSVLMVLERYGKQVTFDEVKVEAKTQWFDWGGTPVGMSLPEYLVKALDHYGVPSNMRQGNLNYLCAMVNRNRPPIVLVRSSKTTWHYVVVIGYNEKVVIIADPGWGERRELTTADFMGAWEFTTDMDGVEMASPCGTCGGTGRWLNYDLGPIGMCEVCNGTGKKPDFMASLLRAAEVYPRTMIVPRINTPD